MGSDLDRLARAGTCRASVTWFLRRGLSSSLVHLRPPLDASLEPSQFPEQRAVKPIGRASEVPRFKARRSGQTRATLNVLFLTCHLPYHPSAAAGCASSSSSAGYPRRWRSTSVRSRRLTRGSRRGGSIEEPLRERGCVPGDLWRGRASASDQETLLPRRVGVRLLVAPRRLGRPHPRGGFRLIIGARVRNRDRWL